MGRRGRSILGKDGDVLFVTTTVMNFSRVFGLGEQYYRILLDSLKFMLREHRACLIAYVLMPSHIHLLLYLPPGEHISDFMRDFKKYTSVRIRQRLEDDGQLGYLEKLHRNAVNKKDQRFKLWKDRFDDVVITTEKMLGIKIQYIHENPVRAGLVQKAEEWKYSSERDYQSGKQGLIDVTPPWELEEAIGNNK